MVLILLAGLLSLAAFVVLVRLLWLSAKDTGPKGLVIAAAAVLLAGLAVLTATGRLHWLAALGTAMLPFARRALGLVRWLPWLSNAYRAHSQAKAQFRRDDGTPPGAKSARLSRAEALEVLGLSGTPSRAEVVAAHRRLMQKLHPDRGGSTYLAQQLNAAKDTLLRDT